MLLRGALCALALLRVSAADAAPDLHHGLSLMGKLKYPADYNHFDYVNPDAPKGGTVNIAARGTFDNLNTFIHKGNLVQNIGLIYETLLGSSLEEPSTGYGRIAKWVSYPPDFSSATFYLRNSAKWHDGAPITVEDVIFSLNTFTKHHPFYGQYYKNVEKAEKTGEREVTFRFDVKNNRELPHVVGQLPILPKHYWERAENDVTKTTLEPPLGSGPYRIGKLTPGRSITYERAPDYWGRNLPVNRGQYNFDKINYEYYRDGTVAFEAFKSGRIDFYPENNSKNWATGYDFQAVKDGRVVRKNIQLKTSQPMQGFVFNTRRKKFADRKVRRAFNLAFDFEWSNKNLFYGQYTRTDSYFENTELAASGLPEGRELEILNKIKDQLPEEVFTRRYQNPHNPSPQHIRKNLRKAVLLLKEAGWEVRDRKLVNLETEEAMQVEFLLVAPAFERIVMPYVKNLQRLGIQCSVRVVDDAQYIRRLNEFNFDIIVGSFSQSHSPGNEQRDFWSSASADIQGSRNLIGIKSKEVDYLVEKVIFASDRADLVAATRALDRVLLWGHYVVPQWFIPYDRIAYWDKFAHPAKLPDLSTGFLNVWWQKP
jgi:microcin C transport system substrate-binding protein